MKIILYPKSSLTHHKVFLNLMQDGLNRHGITTEMKVNFDRDDNPDLAIIWGHKRKDLINFMRSNNRPYIVMERGYIGDRLNWTSVGYNGLNGRADFKNSSISDQTRWNKHFSEYPLEYGSYNNGDSVLLIGQVIGDSAIEHVNITQWYEQKIIELNKLGFRVIFREHPLNKLKFNSALNKLFTYDRNERLEDTLKSVRYVVTFSSNSGVISLLHGVPTISSDLGSMIYSVSDHDVSLSPKLYNLDIWKAQMAYTQWLPEEIKNGDCWEHLKI